MKILKYLKSSAWPSFHNSFHPYVLRAPALAFATACLLFLQVVTAMDGRPGDLLGASYNITEYNLVQLTNRVRVEADLEPLRTDNRLSAAARAKAEDMFRRNYWDHYGPSGTTPGNFIHGQNYHFQYAGENMAKDFQTSKGVMAGWMKSQAHRDNLLNDAYRDIGVAVMDGYLDGRQTTLAVAVYAVPENLPPQAGLDTVKTGMVLPAATGYSMVRPLNIRQTLPPAAQAGVVFAAAVAAAYTAQHLVIRKRHLLWDAHIHPRPLLKAALLTIAIAAVLQNSFGAVG